MSRRRAGVLAVGIAALGAAAYFGWTQQQVGNPNQDLIEQTKAQLVYVEGGSFEAGTYQRKVLAADGTTSVNWMYDAQLSRPPTPVTLDSFYLAAHEVTNAQFALFNKARGLPDHVAAESTPPDDWGNRPAAMTWQAAEAYCVWLGEVSGVSMRLPTEDEWEFAARSRGMTPPWPTSDGRFRLGINVPDRGRDIAQEFGAIGQFPPSPMGFYDMATGRYEWTALPSGPNPDDIRIAKGGSNRSTAFAETIPSRFVSQPMTNEMFQQILGGKADHPVIARLTALGQTRSHDVSATARCAADVTDAPATSGFGTAPDLTNLQFPDPIGPYDHRGRYLGDD